MSCIGWDSTQVAALKERVRAFTADADEERGRADSGEGDDRAREAPANFGYDVHDVHDVAAFGYDVMLPPIVELEDRDDAWVAPGDYLLCGIVGTSACGSRDDAP